MKVVSHQRHVVQRARWAYGLGLLVALGVLAATILLGLLFVRGLVRQQISQRDADALYATTLMEQLDLVEMNNGQVRSDEQIGFDAAVNASRLKGVMGIRFYNTQGIFSDSFPPTIQPQPLDRVTALHVALLKPHSRFRRGTPLSDVFIYLPQFTNGPPVCVPTLEVTVPLHRSDSVTVVGAAQFIIEGGSIAHEYSRMDRRLSLFAALLFAMASALMLALLWPAFHRMEKLNRDLLLHSERLQRANEELALTARVSAVGAISAHLMHGLKNPLASLSHVVSSQDPSNTRPDSGAWKDVLAASHRMQALVERTLEVLCDARGEPTYELTVEELVADLLEHVAGAAALRKVDLTTYLKDTCTLSSRITNLLRLILVNLLENAIEATPPGGAVSLSVSQEEGHLRFRVRDTGAGFPDHLRAQLFLPCQSTRDSGSGIGLAISKKIADYLEAKLELAESTLRGCIWLLELPLSPCDQGTG
jgi:signal transduction histidine kinase